MRVEIENPRSKCYQCMRPSSSCMCKHTNPILTKTRFIILMHPKEFKKEKNGTGHLTKLQLENSEIIDGVDFTHNQRVNEILSNENSPSFLLYPGNDTFNISTRDRSEIQSHIGSSATLFILDATWPCARKMLKLSTNLHHLNRVSFDNHITSKFIIKQQPKPLCLSTIESVYTVLNLFKDSGIEDCNTDNFLRPFEKMIEYQLECVRNPNNKHYRPTANRDLTPKNRYNKSTDRNILFEQKKK